MENKKITNIQDLIDILEFYKRSSAYGKFNKEDVYRSAFDILAKSERFGVLKESDISEWNNNQLLGALQLVNLDLIENMPKEGVLARGEKLAAEQREIREKAEASATKSVAATKAQATDIFNRNQGEKEEQGRKYQEARKRAEAKKEQQPTKQKGVEVQEKVKLPKFVVAPEVSTTGGVVYAIATKQPPKINLSHEELLPLQKAKDLPLDQFVTDFVDKVKTSPEVDLATAKLIALEIAPIIKQEILPNLDLSQNSFALKPSTSSVSSAILENKSYLEKVFPDAKQRGLAIQMLGRSYLHNTAINEIQSQIVKNYFGEAAAPLLTGQSDISLSLSPVEPKSGSWIVVDINTKLEEAKELNRQLGEIQSNNFSEVRETFFETLVSLPRPSSGTALTNLSNFSQSIVDLWNSGKGSTDYPSIDPSVAIELSRRFAPQAFESAAMKALTADWQILAVNLPAGIPLVPAGTELQIGFNVLGGGFRLGLAGAAEAGAGVATGVAETAGAAAVGEAAAVTAGTAAGVEAGAAAGTAIAPVIGTAIGAVVGLVLSVLPAIAGWIKEHSDDLAAVFLGGGLLGLMLGNPFIAVGGLGIGAPLAFASGIGLRGAMGRIFGGIGSIFTGAVLPAITAPIIGFLIGFPVLVAIILFIINAGAYVVPPGSGPGGGGSVYNGPVPEECPEGWPILPNPGESALRVTQGPETTSSHNGYEAVDIGAGIGHTVTSRHKGIVKVFNFLTGYLKHVRIESICKTTVNGVSVTVTFESVYAHLSTVTAADGTVVNRGDTIGESGFSVSPNIDNGVPQPHLHYEFRPPSGDQAPPLTKPLLMDQPFIPVHVPYGCIAGVGSGCGVAVQ